MQVIEKEVIDPFWYRNYAHTQLVTDIFFSAMEERFPNKFKELMSLIDEGNGEVYKSAGRYFIGINDPEVAQEFDTLFKQLVDRYGTEAAYTNSLKYDVPMTEEFELAPLPEGAVEIDLESEDAFYFLRKYFAVNKDSEEYNVSLEDVAVGVVDGGEPSQGASEGGDPAEGTDDIAQDLEERIREVIAKYQLPVDEIVKEIIDVIT